MVAVRMFLKWKHFEETGGVVEDRKPNEVVEWIGGPGRLGVTVVALLILAAVVWHLIAGLF